MGGTADKSGRGRGSWYLTVWRQMQRKKKTKKEEKTDKKRGGGGDCGASSGSKHWRRWGGKKDGCELGVGASLGAGLSAGLSRRRGPLAGLQETAGG